MRAPSTIAEAPAPAEALAEQLAAAVDAAGAAARREAEDREYDPDTAVGAHFGMRHEAGAAGTHSFDAVVPGYRGWQWEVTVAAGDTELPVTVSEVLLRPGPGALVGRDWVPWSERVRHGDLGVGDVLPAGEHDERLVPGYLASDDPAVEDVTLELGLGRRRVLSRPGRLDAAARWRSGEFGPRSDMARSAPLACGTCGFYLPLAGSLSAAFGVCGNEVAPADGHVVHVEYGCGAHSEVEADTGTAVPIAELVYDDSLLVLDGGEQVRAAAVPGEPGA